MQRLLTIVIPSYRSEKLILSHLKKIPNKYRIIIIENSYNKSLKNKIEKNYKNCNVFLKKNIGFGRAVNFASKKVKTKYFVVFNPDTRIYKNTLGKLINSAEKLDKFGAIGPIDFKLRKNKNKKNIIESKTIDGPIMFFKTKTFIKIKGFDKNFFLYYEENDYFRRCNIANLNLYLVTNSFYTHKITKKNNRSLNLHSTTFSNIKEKNSTYFVGGWHGQWSKFYYLNKYNGYFKVILECLPQILLTILQMFLCFFYNLKKFKFKYYKIEGFFCSLIGLNSFKRSIYDKKNIF